VRLPSAGDWCSCATSFDTLEGRSLPLVVPEASLRTSVGNTRAELAAVVGLAADGRLRTVIHESAGLEDADRVLDDLAAGRVVGRSVLVP